MKVHVSAQQRRGVEGGGLCFSQDMGWHILFKSDLPEFIIAAEPPLPYNASSSLGRARAAWRKRVRIPPRDGGMRVCVGGGWRMGGSLQNELQRTNPSFQRAFWLCYSYHRCYFLSSYLTMLEIQCTGSALLGRQRRR